MHDDALQTVTHMTRALPDCVKLPSSIVEESDIETDSEQEELICYDSTIEDSDTDTDIELGALL